MKSEEGGKAGNMFTRDFETLYRRKKAETQL
jgi:hypothetical protein